MGWDAQMASCSLDKERIALRGPDGSGMTNCPDQEARDPQPQAEAERSGNGAVDDGDRTRRAAEQDRFGQRAVHRNCKTFNRPVHQISTPPPNEKNARKKLEAANAIDRPNTIWIRRRKPPEVSPKASVRPVTMMMITARILATGPSTDCRIWLSGCSQGMFEPAARAFEAAATVQTAADALSTAQCLSPAAVQLMPLRGQPPAADWGNPPRRCSRRPPQCSAGRTRRRRGERR